MISTNYSIYFAFVMAISMACQTLLESAAFRMGNRAYLLIAAPLAHRLIHLSVPSAITPIV
jgi:hypothetical protein